MSITERLKTHIKKSEGFSSKLYKCPANKWTIGYGFNVEDRGIPKEVAEFWLEYEMQHVSAELWRAFKHLHEDSRLSAERRAVLVDMAFNMGVPRLKSFKKFFKALEASDYETASKEMLDSRWAYQVKGRALFLSEVMRTGVWPE